ncbi:MAG: polysaccharide biosynthesis C-terminal domain-containing protein [Acidimicrobiales bacterium]
MSARQPVGQNQSSVLASALALLGAAVTMAATFGIARLVSSTDLLGDAGVFFLSTTVISIVGTSTAFGTQIGLVYFMPRVLAQQNPDPRGLAKIALGPVAVASVLAAVVVFALAGVMGDLFGGDRSADVTEVLRLLSPTIPAWSLTNGLLGGTRGLGTQTPTAVIQQIGRPLLQIAGLLAVMAFGELTPRSIALAWGIPVIMAAVASFAALVALGGMHGSGSSPVSSKEYWKFVRPNAVSTALQIALERGDVLVIGAILGEVAAAIYGALSRYATAGNFIGYAITQAVSPNLRRAITAGKEAQVKALFHRAAGWMVIATLPYLLIVAIKTVPLADLISEKYVPDAQLLSVLVIGMVVNALTGPVELHLLMRGHSTTTMKVTALSLVIDIVLIVILGNLFGLWGAAIAWAVSLAGKNLINTYFSGRWYGITSASKEVALASAISVLAVVPVALATPNTYAGLGVTLLVAGILGLGAVVVKREELGLADLRS